MHNKDAHVELKQKLKTEWSTPLLDLVLIAEELFLEYQKNQHAENSLCNIKILITGDTAKTWITCG